MAGRGRIGRRLLFLKKKQKILIMMGGELADCI
jgi:hypothetical protein